MFSTAERRRQTEGQLQHSQRFCSNVVVLLTGWDSLCIYNKSRRMKRREERWKERAWLSAPKPNLLWIQKPFPISQLHSRTHHVFPLSCSYLLSLSLAVFSVSHTRLCSDFTIQSQNIFVHFRSCTLWPKRCTKEQVLQQQHETRGSNRGKIPHLLRETVEATGKKTSEGISRGDPQGYSLWLSPVNIIWHCVWHVAVMPVPVYWCAGTDGFRFMDSCLPLFAFL